jgi:hypothetical protein
MTMKKSFLKICDSLKLSCPRAATGDTLKGLFFFLKMIRSNKLGCLSTAFLPASLRCTSKASGLYHKTIYVHNEFRNVKTLCVY